MYTTPTIVELGGFRTATQAGGFWGSRDFLVYHFQGRRCLVIGGRTIYCHWL
jgi:hypothetical protein